LPEHAIHGNHLAIGLHIRRLQNRWQKGRRGMRTWRGGLIAAAAAMSLLVGVSTAGANAAISPHAQSSVPPGTAEQFGSAEHGMVFAGTVNGTSVDFQCGSDFQGTTRTGLSFPVSAPDFGGCDGSTVSVTTPKENGWVVTEVVAKNGAVDKLKLRVPKGGITIYSSAAPFSGCTVTLTPTEATELKGAYSNPPKFDDGRVTFNAKPIPATASEGCTVSPTFAITVTFHVDPGF
jgi:hypothetical protein